MVSAQAELDLASDIATRYEYTDYLAIREDADTRSFDSVTTLLSCNTSREVFINLEKTLAI